MRKETTMADSIDSFLEQWSAAEQAGHTERLETLLTDDFAGIGPLGFTLPRQAWLARHRSRDLRYDSFALAEVQARLYGPAAGPRDRGNRQCSPQPRLPRALRTCRRPPASRSARGAKQAEENR
jgi:hypothetical protein